MQRIEDQVIQQPLDHADVGLDEQRRRRQAQVDLDSVLPCGDTVLLGDVLQ